MQLADEQAYIVFREHPIKKGVERGEPYCSRRTLLKQTENLLHGYRRATDPASRALAGALAASDYLVKPVDLEELAAAINRRMAEK